MTDNGELIDDARRADETDLSNAYDEALSQVAAEAQLADANKRIEELETGGQQ